MSWFNAHKGPGYEDLTAYGCRSGLIVYSTMLSAEQLSNGALLDLGLPVHDAATVSQQHS